MSTLEPEGNRGLPLAPWLEPQPVPVSARYPKYRHLIPVVLLVLAVPVSYWHLYGDQTEHPESSRLHYIWRAPAWLNDLPHPIGLIVSLSVLAAIGWIVLEYWLQSWRRWWFVVLGAICVMGIDAGHIGRHVTAGNSDSDIDIINGWVEITNPGGWANLSTIPLLCGMYFTVLGISFHKLNPGLFSKCLSYVGLQPKGRLALSTFAIGVLMSAGLSISLIMIAAARSPSSRFSFNEAIDMLVVHIPVLLFLGTFILFLNNAIATVGLMVTWLLLFHSADWILKRRKFW